MLFGSLWPYRLPANRSTHARRAAHGTHNGQSQGDICSVYCAHRREVFPPEVERLAERDCSNTGNTTTARGNGYPAFYMGIALFAPGNPIRMGWTICW